VSVTTAVRDPSGTEVEGFRVHNLKSGVTYVSPYF
jgi:hypothetical protein